MRYIYLQLAFLPQHQLTSVCKTLEATKPNREQLCAAQGCTTAVASAYRRRGATMRLPRHLVLIITTTVAAPETTVHEQIRSALATGEAALQASRWRASSDAYERALHLMKHHKLQINVAAESQLTNNVAWAAFKLGDHERALRHYEASARSCDAALRDGFNECLNKVYDNLHGWCIAL